MLPSPIDNAAARVRPPLARNNGGWRPSGGGGEAGLYARVPFAGSTLLLSAKQTINGNTGTTVLEYDASDLSGAASSWTARVGPTLTFGAFGVVPKIGCPCPLPDTTKKIAQFTNGTTGQYLSSGSTGADLDTDDLVVTFYGSIIIGNGGGTSAGRNIVGKVAAGGFTAGMWRLGATTTSGQVVFSMHIGGARFDISATASQTSSFGNALIQVFIDRSDTTVGTGCALYVNGKRLAVGTFTGAQAATLLNNASKICIGGADGATTTSSVMSGSFSYFRLEKRANWFVGGAQNLTDWDAAALAFTSSVFGWDANKVPSGVAVQPNSYTGNTGVINIPTLMADGSVQYAPISSAVDGIPIAYNPAYSRYMMWPCDDSTNRALQADNFTSATWTKTECTVAASSTVRSRYNGNDAAQFVASAVNTAHFVEQTVAAVVAATYTQSIFIKPNNVSAWKLSVGSDTAKQAYFTFPASPSMGQALSGTNLGANITRARARHFGDGWWRCEITHTTSSSATQVMRVGPVASAGVDNFAGDGTTINGWISCAQLEAQECATHYINTGGSTTTRSIDYLQTYNFAPDTITSGRIEARIGLTSDQSLQSSLGNSAFIIFNGSASARFSMSLTTAQKPRWIVRPSGSASIIADITAASAITGVDGTPPKLVGSFATNNYKIVYEGSTVASQASGGTSTATNPSNFSNFVGGGTGSSWGNYGVCEYAIYTIPL